MRCTIADLRDREVINSCTGDRLGYVCDVLMDTNSGCIAAFVLPGDCGFFRLWRREDDIIIPWDCVKRIGDDLIIVEIKGELCREKHIRRRL